MFQIFYPLKADNTKHHKISPPLNSMISLENLQLVNRLRKTISILHSKP